MTDRDRLRLAGVHAALVAALVRVFDEMDAEKAPLFVVCGVRTDAEQMALYAQGRTKPGLLVTYKDGVKHRSNHQPHADGFGYAVDCAFIGAQPFDPRWPWEMYGEALEAHGLTWGGRWKMADQPHAELAESRGLKA
jgi:peptidoglycan L-alanyl-D-glutamate endopeptidase CwlK